MAKIEMTNTPAVATLDHNGTLPVEITPGEDGITLRIGMGNLSNPVKLGAQFTQGLTLVAGDESISGHANYIGTPGQQGKDVNAAVELSSIEVPDNCKTVTLKLYGEPIVTFDYKDGTLVPKTDLFHLNQRLLVDETRMLADYDPGVRPAAGIVPVKRSLFDGFDPKLHAPITDLHTHSSAQISAPDMMKLAKKHDIKYPLELLELLHIELSEEQKTHVVTVKGIRFSPCEADNKACEKQGADCEAISLHDLTETQQLRLQNQLKVDVDNILCFSDFDREYYRYVNPIVKNPKVAYDMIKQIGSDYAKQGVQYAELSTASMLNLDTVDGVKSAEWFKEMIRAVEDVEKDDKVKLRFLISVPRSYSQAKVKSELEKIKFAARHPLIAGVDLVGYEFNSTSDFTQTLEEVARWAQQPTGTDLKGEDGWNFKRDFTIRIHAGETGKNSDNVAEAVRIAEKYHVHIRIAHAIHEKPDAKIDLAIQRLSTEKPPRVSMEFCAPSNIAYNNIQYLQELKKPYQRWLKCCKSWFLGSDGAGAMQTDPAQMALSALATGSITVDDLANMRRNEQAFIDNEAIRYGEKCKSYLAHYPGGDADFLKEFAAHVEDINKSENALPAAPRIKAATVLPKNFNGKMPILVAGASAASISDLTNETQQKIRRAMHMLVNATDPKKAYFVVGRSKDEGITAALNEAIVDYNERHPTNQFDVLALTLQGAKVCSSVTKIVERAGGLDEVPDALIHFMKEQKESGNPGVAVFIGGGNFTSHMVRKCKNESVDYFLMENAPGASRQFSYKTDPARLFNDGKGLLTQLSNFVGEKLKEGQTNVRRFFKDDTDPSEQNTLNQLIQNASDWMKQKTQSLFKQPFPIDRGAPMQRRGAPRH